MSRRSKFRAAALLVGLGPALAPLRAAEADPPTLARYPTASTTGIAFVAHADLWIVPRSGGVARRVTHDPGAVLAPKFSPDGRWIAFTGRHAGGQDVYLVSAAGGEPRRLTFDAPTDGTSNLVVTWTPDSRKIIFLSKRSAWASKVTQAYAVPAQGGLAVPLPLDHAGLMTFADDGHRIAYNPIFRNLELRKRYVGGQAQAIYTYDFDTRRLARITDWRGTDTSPMWFARKVYFLSDRGAGFRANIWVRDLDTGQVRQVTGFTDYDIDTPSLGGGAITFQQGGKLYAVELPSERLREIAVDVPDDGARTAPRAVAVGRSARVTDVTGAVDYALSPDGSHALFSARGDLFEVSAAGASEDITNTPGADEEHPAWSLDGRSIAYATDADGEQQIAIRPAAGGAERIVTHFRSGYLYTPVWSPDGETLAIADANHGLWLAAASGAAPRLVARDPYAEIRDASFSPDARWLAYSTVRPNQQRAIHLHELATGRDVVVSDPMDSDRDPVFSPDGRLLCFVSQRNELPFVSDRDEETIVATLKSDGLYAATLDRSLSFPVSPVRPAPAGTPAASTTPRPSAPIRLDLDGLMSRAVALPTAPAEIVSLEARGGDLFYETRPPQLIDGDLPGEAPALRAFDIGTRLERVVIDGLDNHSLSADGTRLLYRRDGAWHVADTRPGAGHDAVLGLGAMRAQVDPRREWTEMFENAWRLDRDVFFSKAMNGDDWRAVHDAYARLLPLLGSQDDFIYLLSQIQGEIASSHTFLKRGAGDDPGQPVDTPLLGADYALDAASGRYRFARIYEGDNTRPRFRGPLTEPGLDIRQGDYLLAVNGHELRAPADPFGLFVGAKDAVTLTVARSSDGPRRDVHVRPVEDELALRQADWIEHARRRVARLSGGRVGYVYLSDFDALGSEDFFRQFYPQLDKQGLVFDIRWNNGGFTSQFVLNVLRRERAGGFVNREGAVAPLPAATAPRAMVTLMNHWSASDGDQFPFYFRKFGLGPLVGTRSWGGVQGINGPWRLMDGSFITIPKDSLASPEGHWIIENEGVAPDIEVEDVPDEAVTGGDIQLDTATRAVLEQIERHPPAALRAPPALPAYPPGGEVPPYRSSVRSGG